MPLASGKDESIGSSCVSFNPFFKKANAEHELKPRKRDWQNTYHPTLAVPSSLLPEKPQTSEGSHFNMVFPS